MPAKKKAAVRGKTGKKTANRPATRARKYVYLFGGGKADGKAGMKNLLGGKGANLAEMAGLGLPVPPGFTITTEMCAVYYEGNRKYPPELDAQVRAGMAHIEKLMGAKFGDPDNPLLVSVRSGARTSMPGMMETVLNLGLTDVTVQGLIRQTGNERFAYDAYRRFVQMYGDVVLGLRPESKDEHDPFEEIIAAKKQERGVRLDTDLTAQDLSDLVASFKAAIRQRKGIDFPEDPWEQLWGAVNAVFGSWMGARAVKYREIHGIPSDWGTAVNVQAMVFGNMGDDSATGVAFTRNPATGDNRFYGEYLINAQGEDVVAGIRTPQPINEASRASADQTTLDAVMSKAYNALEKIRRTLERHYQEMQDIEFTVQRDRLWMLQTRTGKRTAAAAVKIAVDMVKERLITKAEAVSRVTPEQIDQLLHPTFDPKAEKKVLARGLPASPGAAAGRVVFHADEAEAWAGRGEQVILVRVETSPEDIGGMNAAQGILTARGGMTCIAGETRVLTDAGFFTAADLFSALEQGRNFRILSFDHRTLQPVWRSIIAAGKRVSPTITVAVSQTGRASNNLLQITSDHKMYTLRDRELIKKPLEACLRDGDFLCVPDVLPAAGKLSDVGALAYAAGAIFTDGHIRLRPTKGSVTFCQKDTPEKEAFIGAVRSAFFEAFGETLSYSRVRHTQSNLRGRSISGSVQDLISFKREPARLLSELQNNLVPWVLTLDRPSLLRFLAGVVDGDGTLAHNRLMIFIGKQTLLQGVVAACLRLGIVPQVTSNRSIYNVQIVEGVEDILAHTCRVKGQTQPRRYGSKLFGMKHLFSDLVGQVDFMGRVKEALKRNLLFDAAKIRRDLLPLCDPESRQRLETVLASSLRMHRVHQVAGPEPTEVYNFEVESAKKLDKNFVVFTSRYTPVLVSNSHAAVVARGMGKCCVAGCGALNVNYAARVFEVNGAAVREGDWISLDGSAGEVLLGRVPTVQPELSGDFGTLMKWVDEIRRINVRTNADTPNDARVARNFGAEGIGLCRTEHMFFEGDRIKAVREMILADDEAGRRRALDKLLPYQKGDFLGIFRAMNGLPVTIRTLDPPLHEFLPHEDDNQREMAAEMGVPVERIRAKVASLHEFNPMLGHRGCRLGITYPEITEMQARAIFEAACELAKEGVRVLPEVMIPLVGTIGEMQNQKEIVIRTARQVMKEKGVKVKYLVGTMIEVPRAALVADQIAQEAEFFSFGTNDLTQMTFGYSRDDAGKFLGEYVDRGVLPKDPFQTLDQEGVGQLVSAAIQRGRKTRPDLKVGICGEHGGDPESVKFCHRVGMNYVSCSPYRVPIARLAAAHQALEDKKGKIQRDV